MDAQVALYFLAATLVVGAILYLPARYLARRFVEARPGSRYSQPLPKIAIAYQILVVAILLVGFSSQYWAPQSSIGKMLSNPLGTISFFVIVIGLDKLVQYVWLRLARRSVMRLSGKMLAENPVESWADGLAHDSSLTDSEAFEIELFDDDKTPVGFVFSLLRTCFNLDTLEAIRLLGVIQEKGSIRLGRMTRENASSLLEHISAQAMKHSYPLRGELVRCSSEPSVPEQ
jgi:ATP-dependent Clp protease adapter protein ClpS